MSHGEESLPVFTSTLPQTYGPGFVVPTIDCRGDVAVQVLTCRDCVCTEAEGHDEDCIQVNGGEVVAMSHFDMSTTARAKRKARQGRDYVEMPIGLTLAIALIPTLVIAALVVITKAVGVW